MDEHPHKYAIYIKGNTVDEIIEEALHLVYIFVLRSLREHRRLGRNGDYERFTIELLATLQKNRDLYTIEPTGEFDE